MRPKDFDSREELIALLAASRELSPDTDPELADAFLEGLALIPSRGSEPEVKRTRASKITHVPAVSVILSIALLLALPFAFFGVFMAPVDTIHSASDNFRWFAFALMWLVQLVLVLWVVLSRPGGPVRDAEAHHRPGQPTEASRDHGR